MSIALDNAIKAMRDRQPTSSDHIKPKAKPAKVWTAYGLITEDGLDGTEYSEKAAKKEAKDLRAMGCTTKVLKVVGTDIDGPLDMVNEAVRDGKAVGPKLLERVNAAFPASTVTIAKGL